ncbi:MAG: hypothetical protein IKP69_09240 [Oscillospiraceae bacterium]|nr:hypothetical protein [Oscillospiraceae bacterium]
MLLSPKYLDACRNAIREVFPDGKLEMPCDKDLDFSKSLPLCILSAVFSNQEKEETTKTILYKYLNYDFSSGKIKDSKNGQTITDFLAKIKEFPDIKTFTATVLKNNRPTCHILRGELAQNVALKMKELHIDTVQDFQNKNQTELAEQLCSIDGIGEATCRYIFMLTGDASQCKPDRWLMRFMKRYSENPPCCNIQKLFTQTVQELRKEPEFSSLTVALLDYAVWESERRKDKQN